MAYIRTEKTDMPVNKEDLEGWLKEGVWVTYAMDTRFDKKLRVSIGSPGFQVIHGQELVYDGPHMANAVEAYNAIKSDPNPADGPKLDD